MRKPAPIVQFFVMREIASTTSVIPVSRIEGAILLIRGKKVMLDADLAELYGVETGALNRAVLRNRDRFPEDFMFRLSRKEFMNLRCQFGISSCWGGRRYPPLAFTEFGVAMLSSVLRSPRAVQVNIDIMRTFVRLRELLSSPAELARSLKELEERYDKQFLLVFQAIRQIMAPHYPRRRKIGFEVREAPSPYVSLVPDDSTPEPDATE